jgi:hypothetical protein
MALNCSCAFCEPRRVRSAGYSTGTANKWLEPCPVFKLEMDAASDGTRASCRVDATNGETHSSRLFAGVTRVPAVARV